MQVCAAACCPLRHNLHRRDGRTFPRCLSLSYFLQHRCTSPSIHLLSCLYVGLPVPPQHEAPRSFRVDLCPSSPSLPPARYPDQHRTSTSTRQLALVVQGIPSLTPALGSRFLNLPIDAFFVVVLWRFSCLSVLQLCLARCPRQAAAADRHPVFLPPHKTHTTDGESDRVGHATATQRRGGGAMTTDMSAFSSCSSTRTPPPAVRPWRCCRPPALPGWNEPNSALCHRIRPPPARRRRQRIASQGRSVSVVQNLSLVLLFCLLFLTRGTNGQKVVVLGASEVLPRELLFDRSEPPPLPHMLLERRQDSVLSSAVPSTTIRPDDASSATATATGTGLQTASQTAVADLPRPFDTSLGNNFTSTTCPVFFSNFLNNQTFKDCLPLSLLLQTSNSFFTASRSLVRLSQTLDATCNVDFNTCSTLMTSLAQEIQQDTQCGADLEMENPVVTQAYNGFIAYPTLYHAGCLTDNEGKYCLANALTNASAPSSSYIYYLPLGVQLPAGAQPSCNQCLQNTMAIFATTAGNSSQPLSEDYTSAAEQVQMTCGPTFVEASVATSAASTPMTLSTTLTGAVVLLTLIMNLL